MLQAESPLQGEKFDQRSATPSNSCHVSRSSTPAISVLDGIPRHLSALAPPPLPPRSASAPPMAIKPTRRKRPDHQEQTVNLTVFRAQPTDQTPPLPEKSLPETPPLDVINGDVTPEQVPLISEICQLLRLEQFEGRRCRQAQRQLHHAHTVAARRARLVHNARAVQHTFAKCIKSEDKNSFVNLLNAFHEALAAGSEPPEGDNEDDRAGSASNLAYPSSFLDHLPLGSRSAVLDFLARVRHDGPFLADRLAALTSQELTALLPEKAKSKHSDSIFGSSPRISSQNSRIWGYVVDHQVDLLSSHEFSSPLETLVHSVREIAGRRLDEDTISTDVWATVCGRLIAEQKPGSEKLVPAILDLWMSSSSWPGKDRLELWLLQTLQGGSFLLEQPNKRSFSMRAQERSDMHSLDDARRSSFYADSIESLLCLLADQNGASVVPEGARFMGHAIYQKLEHSPGHQRAFPDFVLIRWLLPFLAETIALPEMHGLLLDHFIPENARQSILREVASRFQRVVFDVVYSWKLGTLVPPRTTQLVKSVAGRFLSSPSHSGTAIHPPQLFEGHTPIATSANDVSQLVNALYPQPRAASFSDRDPSYSGLQSSASSISGFSLFQSRPTADSIPIESPFQVQDIHVTSNGDPFAFIRSNGSIADVDTAVNAECEPLREACAAVDDTLVSRSSSGSDQWAFLFSDATTQKLHTMQELIAQHSMAAGLTEDTRPRIQNENDGPERPGAVRERKDDIVEVLLDDRLMPVNEIQEPSTLQSWFFREFTSLIKDCEERSDFIAAHRWFQKYQCFQSFFTDAKRRPSITTVLCELSADKKRSTQLALSILDSTDLWLRSLGPCFEHFSKSLRSRSDIAGQLRNKMWFVAEVRLSTPYNHAHNIASALRTMGNAKKTNTSSQVMQPLRRWSGLRPSATQEAQILDLLSATPNHGGPNKLSNDHSKDLAAWLTRNMIQNLCRGEERLHKLCMEVRKAVDQLTGKDSTLLSSLLFARDDLQVTSRPQHVSQDQFWTSGGSARPFDMLTLRTDVPRSMDAMSSTSSHPLSTRSSRDYLDSWSPSVTNRSIPFWSPAVTEARSLSSATSIGSAQTQAPFTGAIMKTSATPSVETMSSIERLRRHVTSLLLSDLGSVLFANGSETDHAFWTGVGGDVTAKHFRSVQPDLRGAMDEDATKSGFDFDNAFEKLTKRLSLSCNPHAKLAHLYDIDTLLVPYMAQESSQRLSGSRSRPLPMGSTKQQLRAKTSETKIEGFRRLFCNSNTRPETIFRDLQYVAALVPSNVLESTPQGKAFWNAATAILGLKQEACNLMVETADSIIAFHSNNRGHGRSSSVAQQERDFATFSIPSPTPSAEDIGRYSISDAATLLQITAKEGNAVAQRELGTLYLTNPELMDHIIAPLSRPRDVFREELESKWRKNLDPNRCDPTTMSVAHHWMSLSSKGGDPLAKEFLRQREEMERLP